MANFNWIDWIVIAIVFISAFFGLIRGFIKEVISLVTWVAATIVASLFATQLAAAFTSNPTVQSTLNSATSSSVVGGQPVSYLAIGISFIVIFLAVVIVGKLLSSIISGAALGLGFFDRVLGGVFGFVRGILCVLLLMFLVQLTPFAEQSAWTESQLVNMLQPLVQRISNAVEPGIESFKSSVGQKWQNMSGVYQVFVK